MFSTSSNRCHESIYPISFLNLSNLSYVLSQTCPKMCPRPDMSRSRPGHVPDVYSKCPCPDHFGTSPKISWVNLSYVLFYFSNFSHVLAQNCLKMCPWPDMSRTRPGRVPDLSSKCPCPDYFGTYPNRTSSTKSSSSGGCHRNPSNITSTSGKLKTVYVEKNTLSPSFS